MGKIKGNTLLFLGISFGLFNLVLAAPGDISTIAGNGSEEYNGDNIPAVDASLDLSSVAVDKTTGDIFIADTSHHRIRKVDHATQIITTVAGNGTSGFSGDGGPATNANLATPAGLIFDASGNLFIADAGNRRIRRVDRTTQIITTVAGNGPAGFLGDGGPAIDASFVHLEALSFDKLGNLYISDEQRIRRVDQATQIITTVAGNGTTGFFGDGGLATNANLSFPKGVFVDSIGNLFFADSWNHRIRRVDQATQIITTVAGNGNWGYSGDGGLAINAGLYFPGGVIIEENGDLFIIDSEDERIRRVDHATHIITTVAGNGTFGFSGDGGLGLDAGLGYPEVACFDGAGNLLIADTYNNRIRKVAAGPRANDQSVNATKNLPKSLTLIASDILRGSPLTYTYNQPAHGILTGTGANVTYISLGIFSGIDSFSFQAHNGSINSNMATVIVNIGSEAAEAPIIASIAPKTGPISGGTTITISGDKFTFTPTVTFGGIIVAAVSWVDEKHMVVQTPAVSFEGPLDVLVTNPDGQIAVLHNGFTYFKETGLTQFINFPNPFDPNNGGTKFHYFLGDDSNVSLLIYDLFGNFVNEINAPMGGLGGRRGENILSWDGKNGEGNVVANGTYIVRVASEDGQGNKTRVKRKVLVVK